LESVLGQPVIIGIFLGPKRANRKPVLQVMGQDGRLLAIAKIGLTPLSRQLAATEAAALTELKSRWMPVLTPPDVLHFGEWRGHSVLVQSPLNLAAAPIHIDPDVRRDAMLELAHFGEVRTLAWSESDYLDRLEARLSHLSSSGLVSGMRDGIKWLRQRPSTIRFGTWHGDWTAWNMAVVDGKALVWDWERYEHDVPIGFDALHYAFMPALKGRHPKTSGINLLDSAPRTLDRFGSDPLIAKEIAVCYLMDLAIRYLSDGQADTGVAGGDAAQWLMPVLSTVRTGVSEEMDDQNG